MEAPVTSQRETPEGGQASSLGTRGPKRQRTEGQEERERRLEQVESAASEAGRATLERLRQQLRGELVRQTQAPVYALGLRQAVAQRQRLEQALRRERQASSRLISQYDYQGEAALREQIAGRQAAEQRAESDLASLDRRIDALADRLASINNDIDEQINALLTRYAALGEPIDRFLAPLYDEIVQIAGSLFSVGPSPQDLAANFLGDIGEFWTGPPGDDRRWNAFGSIALVGVTADYDPPYSFLETVELEESLDGLAAQMSRDFYAWVVRPIWEDVERAGRLADAIRDVAAREPANPGYRPVLTALDTYAGATDAQLRAAGYSRDQTDDEAGAVMEEYFRRSLLRTWPQSAFDFLRMASFIMDPTTRPDAAAAADVPSVGYNDAQAVYVVGLVRDGSESVPLNVNNVLQSYVVTLLMRTLYRYVLATAQSEVLEASDRVARLLPATRDDGDRSLERAYVRGWRRPSTFVPALGRLLVEVSVNYPQAVPAQSTGEPLYYFPTVEDFYAWICRTVGSVAAGALPLPQFEDACSSDDLGGALPEALDALAGFVLPPWDDTPTSAVRGWRGIEAWPVQSETSSAFGREALGDK